MPQDRSITFEPKNPTRNSGDLVRQGEIYNFYFKAKGTGASGLTGSYSVMQYPGDTPTVTGSLTYTQGEYKGTLSAANTAALSIGQWIIYTEFTDGDEDIHLAPKVYIAKGWT